MAPRKGSAEAIALDLNSAAIHLLRGLRAADKRSGLTMARLSALSVVVFGGPCSLGDLADAEDVTPPTMSRVVDGLVDLGLVDRSADPHSGRKVLISPTPAGERLMFEARQRRIDAIAEALRSLPASERRLLAEAAPVLGDLARRVPAAARGAAPPR